MNPYEKTASVMKGQAEMPKRVLKNVATLAGTGAAIKGAASFKPILEKAAPFLSQYIPEDIAIKGLSKVNPKLGNFVNKALGSGFDFGEVKDFIGEQIEESQQSSKKDISDKNIIKKYSPELHQAIADLIGKGASPIQAAAQSQKQFKKIIQQIEKDYDADYLDIVESIFGKGDIVQNQQQQAQQSQQAQQPQGMGQGQQALMQMLQKINQDLANPQG